MRVELHFHLLPAVDDGPRDDAEAVALARAAVYDGTRTVTVTPHACEVDVTTVPRRVAALRGVLRKAGVPLELLPGAELQASDVLRLGARELGLVTQGPPGRRWVLLEAPFEGSLGMVPAALDRLCALGIGVLIAHPERCEGWWARGDLLESAQAAGAALQVNASSVTGFHGPSARDRALALLEAGRATVLASDAHGPERPPRLGEAIALLHDHGIDAAPLTSEAPAALLRDGLPSLVPAGRLAA